MPRRRLTGIAALSAVTLATATTAMPALAADDGERSPELEFYRQLLDTYAGDEIPDELKDQMVAMFEQMWLADGTGDAGAMDMSALFAALAGDDPAQAEGMAEMLEAILGGTIGDAAFPKVEADVFPKVEIDAFGKIEDEVIGKVEDDALSKLEDDADDALYKLEDMAFPKVEDDAFMKLPADLFTDELADVFMKWDASDPAALEALLEQMADAEIIEPGMIKFILDQLPEE